MEFSPPKLSQPKHPKYDSIHRALLAGLLANVGTKSDTYEYLGLRSTKFSIFPGSALFSQKPKWIMAAELVETTKLYARTNAAIQPQWIEHAAAHLVTRTYSEPRYDSKSASVLATEKVALYGLVLIPARPTPYGPINPRISRELFIHHALVLGEFQTKAPFLRHNAALIAEVESLEAKIRQRNLLADIATRFAFYHSRLPQDIYDGARFETFRRAAEQKNPRLLFMNKDDLLRADAPPITPEYYPDRVRHEGLNLPLRYKFEPADPDDGISLTIPLAALTQLTPERYEWLVPGMLEEKIAAMLRALPGALRRNFVPVPDWARTATQALLEKYAPNTPPKNAPPSSPPIGNWQPEIGNPPASPQLPDYQITNLPNSPPSLREALAHFLSHQAAVNISPSDFLDASLPDHLRMAFKVVDDTGKLLATSRDLPSLQRKLAPQAAGSFSQIHQKEFHRDNITSWDFPDLPDSLTLQRHGMTIHAIPALTDQGGGDSCSLRLFPSQPLADSSHRAGLRRLFRLENKKETKYLAHHIPHFEQMALHFYAHALATKSAISKPQTSEDLREQLLSLIVDRALFADAPLMRKLADWRPASEVASIRLLDTADSVTAVVSKLLAEHHTLRLLLAEAAHTYRLASTDIHDQLAYLLPPHFLLNTPWPWLQYIPRYLAAIRIRLEKLAQNTSHILQRDSAAMHEIAPLWLAYLARKEAHEKLALDDPELTLYRWMLEEFRVHLFAQELGPTFPISARRLEKQWEKIRK